MKKIIALLNCHGDDVYCFRKEIIDALVERGYHVLLSCPDSTRLDAFRNNPQITIEDITIDRRGTNPFHDVKLLIDYRKLFKKYKPDVVCAFTIKPNIYGSIAADMLNIPHINNITGLGSGFQNGGIVQKVVKILYKIALSKAKKVFFQNQENKDIANQSRLLSSKTSYEVIPGSGVNLSRFMPVEKKKDLDKVIFNYIGRVLKDKRIDDYFDAATEIKKTYSNTVFNVIGFVEPTELHYQSKLEELEKKGIIHYCGSVDDVRPYIEACDAIIHPSSYGEGMSNVLLETAATGRAIITTDISGCKETVEDGCSGYIYHAENVAQLVHCINRFMELSDDDRIKMGQVGRRKMEKEFDRQIVVNKYLTEIENIQ